VHRASTLTNGEKGAELTPPTTAECCKTAPPVLEFDAAGNLLRHWGGPGQGYDWPQSMHGIYIDYKGNVWLGGNGAKDSQVSKWTQDGKFLMQIGKFDSTKGSMDTANVHSVAQVTVDQAANELYVADGYGNHRIIVYDADSGQYKRLWGAYGTKQPEDTDYGRYNPDAPPLKQFRNPVHCVMVANDGLVYVCDRVNDRIQIFHKDGSFVKEVFIAKTTRGAGSVWEIAFSKDAAQKYLYLSDGANEKVYILDRDSMQTLTSFGDGGRQPSQFYGVHSIVVDSKGNIFTTETFEGKRVQRFVYKGLAAVTSVSQGAVWPTAR
jgi:DNA-binding beta-propeller fold protein YncE